MLRFRPLPWEYGARNLLRRPMRTALTLAGLTLVALLVFIVVGFIRGLEASLDVSGEPGVVLVHTRGSGENIENSSVNGSISPLLSASLPAVARRLGPEGGHATYASPELYLGTRVIAGDDRTPTMGLVRGVTPQAALVRGRTQLLSGQWPGPGEVLVGRLAAAKLGRDSDALAIGRTLEMEGRSWTVCGMFASAGSSLESEIWVPLDDLQQTLKRQDLSVVAIKLAPGASIADVAEFCMDRIQLEIQATPETAYYQALRKHYRPVRLLAWLVAGMVASAGVFVGLNTMYSAAAGRIREIATLQTIGFSRRAIALSMVQEGVLLSAAGTLTAAALAGVFINGMAVRFTMGAFTMRVDAQALAIGSLAGLAIGALGAIPPALRAMRLPVADGLKAI